jgi:flagellar biosynthesis/type III secretory pathway protein FliH
LHWLNFWAFGGLKGEQEMSQIVESDPLVMEAVAELQRFSSDTERRELERRRKLWKLEYYSGLEAAKEEGFTEGKTEGEVKSIIRTLTKRFQIVSPSTNKTILAMTDLDVIERLADFAYDCQSLPSSRQR